MNIVDDVTDWAARLVFSPAVWLGSSSPGRPPGCSCVSGLMRSRGIGVRRRAGRPSGEQASRSRSGRKPERRHDDDLDDMADIEAILKKHGI